MGGDEASGHTRGFRPIQYQEKVTAGLSYLTPCNRIMVTAKSDFQDIKLVETADFGKCLILDNQMQSALNDEACYHEALVHPAMLSHPNPKRVFIGGGGEGATAREVLKHQTVEACIMSDLDEKVCDFCREHMSEWNAGVWEDQRFTCYYEDAKARLELEVASGGKFDVIIMDICDPLDAGPGWVLYSVEFYKLCKEKYLQPNGVLVTQSTACDPAAPGNPELDDPFPMLHKTLTQAFGNCNAYHSQIPSFYYPWGFNMACEDASILLNMDADIAKVDALIAERLGKASNLRHYDGITHRHMFSLPKGTRGRLAAEKRIFTEAEPIFCQRS